MRPGHKDRIKIAAGRLDAARARSTWRPYAWGRYLSGMPLAIRPHNLALHIDDDTWAALERTARARGESAADVVVYAVELFLEQRGFVPAWAQQPLDARLTRRRAKRQP